VRPITIVDCGLSNIDSAVRALEYCGGDPVVTRDPETVRKAGRLVLPGVGAFPEAMQRLNESGLADAIRESALASERPILGICLGMQLMATAGQENEFTQGLGLISGNVLPLKAQLPGERIPHMGWNTVQTAEGCALLAGISADSDFYFAHGYHFVPSDRAHLLATTPYCGGVAAIVGKGLAFGAQFHPEKSQATGFSFFKNFIGL